MPKEHCSVCERWHNSTLWTKLENSPFIDDRIFISQDNIWDSAKCGCLTATANMLLYTAILLLLYNTSLHLLLKHTTTPSTAQQTLCHTASYHKSNGRELVHRQETNVSAFCVLLATAKLPSKVGMNKSNTHLFRLAVHCAEDRSSRKGKLYGSQLVNKIIN